MQRTVHGGPQFQNLGGKPFCYYPISHLYNKHPLYILLKRYTIYDLHPFFYIFTAYR